MSDYTITLRSTGLFRAGEHTIVVSVVTLNARVPSNGHRQALLDLMRLIIETGEFVVTDLDSGEQLLLDLTDYTLRELDS